jgi:copper chaperone CopZ
MKCAKLAILGFALITLLAPLSAAAAEEQAQDAAQMAIYKVPELTEDLSKGFIKELAKLEGIVSAKPAIDEGTFAVTFETAKTDPQKIEAVLAELAPEAKLDKVGPAEKAHSGDCSKCPKHKTCGKNKE